VTFATPVALVGLLLVPVLVLVYVGLERRRARRSAAFASPALQPNLVGARPGWRRHAPVALALGAIALLLVGIARPHLVRTVTRDEATIILAIDTSRSMSATDVEPTRLDAARNAITSLLDTLPDTYRIGIVSFSTSAEPVLPPTSDREAAKAALRELQLGSGTAIGDAILRSLQLTAVAPGEAGASAQGDRPPATVILLSDGAQTTEGISPLAAAARARALGVPVSTVALGTDNAVVEVPLAGGLKERVTVPPDPKTMRQVAAATGGTFSEALDLESLQAVYDDLGTRLARERRSVEVTSAFALGGALVLLLGGALSTHWFRRAL
jgi:Ca-activated chloride channel family protein